MANTSAPAQSALADIFLARIPLAERNHAIRDLAANVDNDTIALVAALTGKLSDPQAEDLLQNFLLRSVENGDPVAAASLCLQYPHIGKSLLERAEKEIHVSFALLLKRPKNSGLVVPTSHLKSIAPLPNLQLDEYTDRSLEDIVRLSVVYLNFVRQIFRLSTSGASFTICQSTFTSLLCLLAASKQDIASAARDASFAFLAAYKNKALAVSGLESDPVALNGLVWQYVNSLLEHDTHKSYHTTAYAIWLRWLDLPEASESSKSATQSEAYWKHVLNALANGDTEQRKICLHIVRASLAVSRNGISTKDMVFDPTEPNSETQAQYERYCTVYETIIIGRYLNQAEECMRDLDALASPHTKVQKSWLFALLEPAMSNVIQDSIRKMLGNWLMSSDLKMFAHAAEFSHFLRKSFLPWACQGSLYTSSLRGRTKGMQCEHGTRLSSFIERLLKAHSADSEKEIRSSVTKSVLEFLHYNKTRIIPSAVLYLLHGLVQGLKGDKDSCIGPAELEILLQLPTGLAFPEIARDVLQSFCLDLSQLAETSAIHGVESGDLRLENLAQKVQQMQLGPVPADAVGLLRWKSLGEYLEELHASKYSCLSGEGFYPICQSLLMLLDTLTAQTTDADELYQALDSIWTELEIQDYCKSGLLIMPSLVLHPVCVARSLSDERLAEALVSYLAQLHQFAYGKIYLWAPIMSAMRVALLASPPAAKKLNLADLIVDTVNKPPSAKTEFQLEAALVQLLHHGQHGGRKYTDYYGEHEEAGYAAFFDLVNRLPELDDELAREIFDSLIEPWANQKLPVPIVNKWKTTAQVQVMLILQEKILSTMTESQARYHMDMLHKILAVEPLPRYRLLIEWMIARIIIKHAETSDDILQRLSTMDHHSNPKYLSSLSKIALMIACLEDCAEDFADRLACRLVALSSSSKIIIRHEAQWSFPIIWNVAEARGLTSITKNPACQALNDYIRSLERFSTPPTERELEFLDPAVGYTLANLLQGKYLRIEPSIEEIATAADIQKLLDSDRTNQHLPQALPPGCLSLGEAPIDRPIVNDSLPAEPTQQESKESARTVAVAALQTKGTAYLSANTTESEETKRATDLIVVASLVDNAYNLGGLSRISEIFGASALYMARTKAVLANKDFISVAVASQNHLPIRELSVENLQAFLTEKKTEGYSVVGVEQTDRSVLLGSEACRLPAKTLLVMGAEKEGIPAMVLGECNVLVEIPQRGVTRSMNVQTAASVVLYEYSRQHRGN